MIINFLHTYLPRPILWQWGWLQVHWYGFFVVLAVFGGLLIVIKLAKKKNISSDEVFDLGFYLVIFGLLGARIYAVFLDWPFYFRHPAEIVAVWHGGLAIHGAIFGSTLALVIYCRQKKQSFWLWADLIVPALALGQAIGRWGNYFNQEVFGQPTNLPWGIPIDVLNRPAGYSSFEYFQPTFLYESGLDVVNFCFLVFLFFWMNKRNKELRIKNQVGKWASGQVEGLIFLVYLINYSLIRIGMEFLRIDVTPIVLGVRWPIWVSGGVIGASLMVMIMKTLKHENMKTSLF